MSKPRNRRHRHHIATQPLFGRRQVLALGAASVAAALATPFTLRTLFGPQGSAQAATELAADPAVGKRVQVVERMAPGSVHAMKSRGVLYVVTERGWGLEFPIGVGAVAMAWPDDSFFRVGDRTEGPTLHLHDYYTGEDTGLRIAAAEDLSPPPDAIAMRPEHLAALDRHAPVGAPGILYR